jgi:hypothetical protein
MQYPAIVGKPGNRKPLRHGDLQPRANPCNA